MSYDLTLKPDTLAESFTGFHVGDGVTGTIAAIAHNTNYTTLDTNLENIKAIKDIHNADVDKLLLDAANFNNERGSTPKRYAMLKPYVVWVRGPLAHLPATLCTVDNVYVKTNTYALVTQKARRLVNSMYKGWHQGKRHNEDFAVVQNCQALKWYTTDPENISPFKDATSVSDVRFEVVASLYLAARVQHICDVDAGKMFRDKMGLAAAAQEFSTAAHTLLFA